MNGRIRKLNRRRKLQNVKRHAWGRAYMDDKFVGFITRPPKFDFIEITSAQGENLSPYFTVRENPELDWRI